MNILYTCDNNYVWLMSLSMISLFESNKKASEITVYLIGEQIDKENKQVLLHIAKDYNRKCIIIDLPDIKMTVDLYSERWPRSAFSRLFCAEILPKKVKKIIYLDCDTIVKGDLEPLYNTKNAEKNVVCGVKDCISGLYKKNIGLAINDIYINAGVLLINVELLRKINVFDMINDFIEKYNKRINYADQDVLNFICRGKIGVLNLQYNVRTLEFVYRYKDIIKLRHPNNYYDEEEVNEASKAPAVIHYTTNMTVIRPWFKNSNHPRKSDFVEIYENQDYIQRELQEYAVDSAKNKFLDLLLRLPKSIGYPCLGFIHAILVPLLK